MRFKSIKIEDKSYTLTIDAMIVFDCQQEFKLNLLEKLSQMAACDEQEQAQLLIELWPVTALSLARCHENGFENWQDVLERLTLAEIQALTLEFLQAIGETNSKNL